VCKSYGLGKAESAEARLAVGPGYVDGPICERLQLPFAAPRSQRGRWAKLLLRIIQDRLFKIDCTVTKIILLSFVGPA
jgi:hypothetical protein